MEAQFGDLKDSINSLSLAVGGQLSTSLTTTTVPDVETAIIVDSLQSQTLLITSEQQSRMTEVETVHTVSIDVLTDSIQVGADDSIEGVDLEVDPTQPPNQGTQMIAVAMLLSCHCCVAVAVVLCCYLAVAVLLLLCCCCR